MMTTDEATIAALATQIEVWDRSGLSRTNAYWRLVADHARLMVRATEPPQHRPYAMKGDHPPMDNWSGVAPARGNA